MFLCYLGEVTYRQMSTVLQYIFQGKYMSCTSTFSSRIVTEVNYSTISPIITSKVSVKAIYQICLSILITYLREIDITVVTSHKTIAVHFENYLLQLWTNACVQTHRQLVQTNMKRSF